MGEEKAIDGGAAWRKRGSGMELLLRGGEEGFRVLAEEIEARGGERRRWR